MCLPRTEEKVDEMKFTLSKDDVFDEKNVEAVSTNSSMPHGRSATMQ